MVQKKIKIELAETIPDIWSVLTDEERQLIEDSYSVQSFKKNEIIHCEDEEPICMMCLIKGKVKIFKEGVGGRNQIMRMIRPGQYFAYRAFFANENYLTAAAAFEPSQVCMIPLDVINRIVTVNNKLSMFFIRLLSIDLGVSDSRTVNLTQKHIRGRLAESVLFLKDCYGVEDDGATIAIYLSREDLASLSNMTTSNAIRTLSLFTNEGILVVDGRRIRIEDEAMLRRISRHG
ncbi:MAG: Crp/Fnr family transcriptional regulator [Bacteroidales bacterium]